MSKLETYKVRIDQLPEEAIEATSPEDASHRVAALIAGSDALKRLHDEEPVEIRRPDGRAWGRNLTVGAFRAGPVLPDGHEADPTEGPVRPASVKEG